MLPPPEIRTPCSFSAVFSTSFPSPTQNRNKNIHKGKRKSKNNKTKASTNSFPMENKTNQRTDRDRDRARDREAMACTSRNRARTRSTQLGDRTRHSTGPSLVLASLSPSKHRRRRRSLFRYPSLIPALFHKQEGNRIKIGRVGNFVDRIRTSLVLSLRLKHCKRLYKRRLGTRGKIFFFYFYF